MNITIKDVPEDLHERLKDSAEKSGRSLNKLILYTLQRTYLPTRTESDALISRIRRRRGGMQSAVDMEFLDAAVEDGRP